MPIQIIRTRDISGAAKLSICTPEDLEELAGVEIISYGKFPHAQQSDADVRYRLKLEDKDLKNSLKLLEEFIGEAYKISFGG